MPKAKAMSSLVRKVDQWEDCLSTTTSSIESPSLWFCSIGLSTRLHTNLQISANKSNIFLLGDENIMMGMNHFNAQEIL